MSASTTRRARSTGATVTLYRDAGEECGPGCRYVTLCETHGRLVGHYTLRDARAFAAAPEEWCGVCAGTEPADDLELEVVL